MLHIKVIVTDSNTIRLLRYIWCTLFFKVEFQLMQYLTQVEINNILTKSNKLLQLCWTVSFKLQKCLTFN